MNYEERRIEVCNKCTLHETCGFVLRNMDNKCSDLDDIMLGWELGQQDTLEEIEAKNVVIMDYEKKYKESMAKMSTFLAKHDGFTISKDGEMYKELSEIFPELKESEGEKIRKWLIAYLEGRILNTGIVDEKRACKDAIAWLEKHKDIEAKLIISDEGYNKAFQDGIEEVLTNPHKYGLEKQGEQKLSENKGINLKEEEMTPFQKEVFYIIDTNIEAEVGLKQECDILLALAFNEIKQQQPAWSEEDEKMCQDTIQFIETGWTDNGKSHLIPWVNSLKDRVQLQPKQEWSEEDEKKRTLLISILEVNHPNEYFKVNPANTLNMEAMHVEELVDWLKSLRPQSEWKPSDEQMFALNIAIEMEDGDILKSLYQDLKKLREE